MDGRKKKAVFDQVREGLEDSIRYSRGKLTLVTSQLPPPPPKTTPRKIVALRRNLQMSQAVFAATLNVSRRTVQSWEQGLRTPSDASFRLLQIVAVQPEIIKLISTKT